MLDRRRAMLPMLLVIDRYTAPSSVSAAGIFLAASSSCASTAPFFSCCLAAPQRGAGRIVRTYGVVNSDFSLLRTFALAEGTRLQLRGKFFNAFNHTNLNPPGVVFGSPSFGVVSSAKAARQIQIGAQLVF